MVTRKQERALREEIESLKSDVRSLYHYREERDKAMALLQEYVERMPADLAEKAEFLLVLGELSDAFPPEDPVADSQGDHDK